MLYSAGSPIAPALPDTITPMRDAARMVARRVGPVVDSNVHLWAQGRNPVFWLEDRTMLRDMLGDYDSLPDTYTLADYTEQHRGSTCGASSGPMPVRSTRWQRPNGSPPEHCRARDRTRRARRPADPGFEQFVTALRANVLVTSVRVRLVPAFQPGAPAAAADTDGRLTDALELLADQELVATIEAGPSEIARVADLARRFPRLQVVLDHFGWPDDLSDSGRRAHLALLRRWQTSQRGNAHRRHRHDLPRVGHRHASTHGSRASSRHSVPSAACSARTYRSRRCVRASATCTPRTTLSSTRIPRPTGDCCSATQRSASTASACQLEGTRHPLGHERTLRAAGPRPVSAATE